MRARTLVMIGIGAAVAAFVWARRRSNAEGAAPVEPRPRASLVDVESEDSFPASDPPSSWGREPA